MPRLRKHAVRDEFAFGFLKPELKPSATVLDVGCGRDAALAAYLEELPARSPARYVGLEAGTVNGPKPTWAEYRSLARKGDYAGAVRAVDGEFTVVACLTPEPTAKLVAAVAERLAPGGVAFVRLDAGATVDAAARSASLEVAERFGVATDANLACRDFLGPAEARVVRRIQRLYDGKKAPGGLAGFVAALLAEEADVDAVESIAVLKRPAERVEARKEAADDPGRISASGNATPPRRRKKRTRPVAPAGAGAVESKSVERRKKVQRAPAPAPAPPTKLPDLPLKVVRVSAAKSETAVVRFDADREFRGSGALMRFMLQTGRYSDDAILAVNAAAFPWSKAQKSDVNYNRRKLEGK